MAALFQKSDLIRTGELPRQGPRDPFERLSDGHSEARVIHDGRAGYLGESRDAIFLGDAVPSIGFIQNDPFHDGVAPDVDARIFESHILPFAAARGIPSSFNSDGFGTPFASYPFLR